MDKIFGAANNLFEWMESRMGRGTVMILTGLIFLVLAGFVTAVRWETFYHGNGFTRLSLHPFEFESENNLRFRILSPLLGHFLFFRGPLFKYFMLGVLALFFGLIYHLLRKKEYDPASALGITAVCSFSTLSFYQFYFPAYTDPLSFLLVLLYLFNYRNIYMNMILLCLMLFNHENTIFLFPFFLLLTAGDDFGIRNLLKIFLRFFIAAVPYLIFRKYISSHAPIEFTISYYFDPHNMEWTRQHVLPHLLSGIFQAFRLSWIILLAAIAIDFYEKRYREILLLAVIVVFVLSQLTIAWDISRLVGMSFPAIIISAMRLKTFLGTSRFLLVIYSIILINFFIPAYCIGALDPIPYRPLWLQ